MQCAFAILYRRLRPAWHYSFFPNYLTNGKVSEKKMLKTKYMSETLLILKIIQRDTIIHEHLSLVKCPLFLSDPNQT